MVYECFKLDWLSSADGQLVGGFDECVQLQICYM